MIAATGLKIDLERISNWVAFLFSRQDLLMPVANCYVGVFRDGEVKIRGIEARRLDTPNFICNAQQDMIRVLAGATNRAEFRERATEVMQMACGYLDQLRAGQAPLLVRWNIWAARWAMTRRGTRDSCCERSNLC